MSNQDLFMLGGGLVLPVLLMLWGAVSLFFLISGSSPKKAGSKSGQHQVRLLDVGPKKIQVIREIRSVAGISLQDAKDLLARERREKAGATVEVIWPGEVKKLEAKYQVFLTDVGPNKSQVMQEIQLLTGLDTAEVRSLVDRVPSLLLDDVDEAAAFHAISRIEGAGGMTRIANDSESSLKTVVLVDAGRNKIAVIKVIRELTDLGLKEAKDLAERLPSIILDAVSSEAAARARTQLEQAGAVVKIE
jgi:large subunit ribosomal protein L7/L12